MKNHEKIREFLNQQSLDELSYILGRYCGPYNVILSEKKFGYAMPKRIVEEIIIAKTFEIIILTSCDSE